ncbi:MAG: hypothetical protein JW716_04520 [Candidatus Aenigmarchaeota archaeon]|nr:hypothetical protein [Candidatus Aenigmarchaeota archaeon]
MKKHIKKVRKSPISRDELIADGIFIFISFIASFAVVFLFDVHHSFYEMPVFPLEFIFKTTEPYYYFTFVGTIALFVLIKLFIYGIQEDEKALEKRSNNI